ncbi:helix-turn-helix domain-containing protein [Saccharopolyspora sp. 5N708]|uniref:helix-turn-helix domain-containing protein n=1 Tax=Saccharopolyspora sp. 5N708 TaxID=3457424 RepID=UPI003FCEEC86
MTVALERTVLPPDSDPNLTDLARVLASEAASKRGVAVLVGPDGNPTPLPDAVFDVLRVVVDVLARGMAITIAPHNTMLTTQEAADLLGISRPTLVRLLEGGEVPFEMRGRHRRVRLADLVEYQTRTRRDRERALGEMAERGEKDDIYSATVDPTFTR